jgi:hypothetical protein
MHKRLMLLAGISVLTPRSPAGFLTGAARRPACLRRGHHPPAFVAYLLLVAAMIFDWRTRGRPHPVYVYGGLALVALKLLNWPLSTTSAWHSFAGGILALAQ